MGYPERVDADIDWAIQLAREPPCGAPVPQQELLLQAAVLRIPYDKMALGSVRDLLAVLVARVDSKLDEPDRLGFDGRARRRRSARGFIGSESESQFGLRHRR